MTSAATFEVGEVMVFGSEGFARVEAVGEKVALGRTAVFIDLFVFDANMRVSVPVERALERGLRPIASADEIEGVLDSLQEARWTSIPWNRDGRLVKERYAEGGLEAILDTLGSLVELAGTKKLNDAQRTLLDRARRALVLETSAALGIEEAEAARARRRPARRGRLTGDPIPPMTPATIPWTGDDEADRLLAADANALLIGFVLDQQVPVQKAFSGPRVLQERLGHLDPARIAEMDPEAFVAICVRAPRDPPLPGRDGRPRAGALPRARRTTTTATARASGARPPTAPTCTRASARCRASAT